MRKQLTLIAFASGALLSAAAFSAHAGCRVTSTPFGTLTDGRTVEAWHVDNGAMSITVLSLGGILHDINVPDRAGRIGNVVRNLSDLSAYEKRPNFSSLIGRYANRIGGPFVLDGQSVTLTGNARGVSSHGGPTGFGSRIWQVRRLREGCGVALDLVSPDGDNGFPGALGVNVQYRLQGHRLKLDYTARTSKPTVINLTHHAFFNLSGGASVYDQSLRLNASHCLLTDATRIPTGESAAVDGTPLDLRHTTVIGKVVSAADASIKANKGLDHTFVLDGAGLKPERFPKSVTHFSDQKARKSKKPERRSDPIRSEYALAAVLSDAASGRTLTVRTTEPGLVVYTAGGFDGSLTDVQGRSLAAGAGIALETQHFPDSPRHDSFPSTVLRPGETFRSTTTYDFSAR